VAHASVVPFCEPEFSTQRKHRATRQKFITRAQLGKRSHTAKLFDEISSQIITDLSGGDPSKLSRIELELVEAFTGAAVLMRHVCAAAMVKSAKEPFNIAAFASAATAMSRIGGQLGLTRRQKEVLPSLNQYLREKKQETGA
jgi:hypothetical protein